MLLHLQTVQWCICLGIQICGKTLQKSKEMIHWWNFQQVVISVWGGHKGNLKITVFSFLSCVVGRWGFPESLILSILHVFCESFCSHSFYQNAIFKSCLMMRENHSPSCLTLKGLQIFRGRKEHGAIVPEPPPALSRSHVWCSQGILDSWLCGCHSNKMDSRLNVAWGLLSVRNPSSFSEVTKTHPWLWTHISNLQTHGSYPALTDVFEQPVNYKWSWHFF